MSRTIKVNMLNSTLMMSNADFFSNDQPINPYYSDEPFDKEKAKSEHHRIRQCFLDAGITVIDVPAPEGAQDGVYTANWALIRGKKAVLSRLPDARKTEEAWAQQQLEEHGFETVILPHEWRSSGQGDALPCGNYLFCGSVYRSDARAQAFTAEMLGYERIQLQTIPLLDDTGQPVVNASSGWPDSFFYDLDLALSIIKAPTATEKGLVAYCPDAFTKESQVTLEAFDKVDKIIVPFVEAKDAAACNLVSTGSCVIMSPNAPIFKQRLEERGLHVVTVAAPELLKAGGYIRCVSLAFNE